MSWLGHWHITYNGISLRISPTDLFTFYCHDKSKQSHLNNLPLPSYYLLHCQAAVIRGKSVLLVSSSSCRESAFTLIYYL